ncbi:MAG TPA: hypothetical protein PLS06_09990, partial [Proteiniphilum sp.]|nr:hypothetical protein [Proteiniphilum sp.]
LDWTLVIANMEVERDASYIEGYISEDQYDKYQEDIYDPMVELISDGNLSTDDTTKLSDLYYNYLNTRAWEVTTHNPTTFIVFAILLFIALVSMATFRSPAVALMPEPRESVDDTIFAPTVVALVVVSFPANPFVSHAKSWARPWPRPIMVTKLRAERLRSVNSFLMEKGFWSGPWEGGQGVLIRDPEGSVSAPIHKGMLIA